ncbi:MAG TPA: DJ-1/PfpI family protein [Caulobacteraceae bacterium]|jgi:cyclohexyl-isocyanide hydratase
MLIGIPIYEEFDLLDLAGPWEMFKWAGYTIEVVAETPGLIASNGGPGAALSVEATTSFAQAGKWDALWTPGGSPKALNRLMTRPSAYLDFLCEKAAHAKYVCSVCEGALLLAAAGLLDGYTATTHWAFVPCFLQRYPKVKMADGFPRYHLDRNRLTGGGIASGLDESLELIRLLSGEAAAEAAQQNTQYYPDPPVWSEIPQTMFCPLDAP